MPVDEQEEQAQVEQQAHVHSLGVHELREQFAKSRAPHKGAGAHTQQPHTITPYLAPELDVRSFFFVVPAMGGTGIVCRVPLISSASLLLIVHSCPNI